MAGQEGNDQIGLLFHPPLLPSLSSFLILTKISLWLLLLVFFQVPKATSQEP